jgi:hypothetical protein
LPEFNKCLLNACIQFQHNILSPADNAQALSLQTQRTFLPMLLLMLLTALVLEESLSTLHLHEGLTHTELVSGDSMPARDDC